MTESPEQVDDETAAAGEPASPPESALEPIARILSVGRLGPGIAHEINNPLQLIRLNLTLLKDVCSNALSLLSRIAHEPGDLRLAVNLPLVFADTQRVQHCVAQLVLNAGEAILARSDSNAHEKSISIGTRHDTASGRVLLRIRYEGCGIPPDVQARAFEPFFTTKDRSKHVGIGLTLVAKVVQHHGGSVNCESQEGNGTCVEIGFPTRAFAEHDTAFAEHDTAFAEEDASHTVQRGGDER